jgi:hypothetical protein
MFLHDPRRRGRKAGRSSGLQTRGFTPTRFAVDFMEASFSEAKRPSRGESRLQRRAFRRARDGLLASKVHGFGEIDGSKFELCGWGSWLRERNFVSRNYSLTLRCVFTVAQLTSILCQSRLEGHAMLRCLLFTALASVAINLAPANANDQPPPDLPKWMSAQTAPGRYQIVMSAMVARHVFLLDTTTGRVWQCVVNKSGDELWEEMEKIDLK